MPSTATTNVTIGTILDLLGPPSSAASTDGDQSAFGCILNEVRPTTPTASPATNNRSTTEPNSSRAPSEQEARHASESSSRDDSANQTSETDHASDAQTESHAADDVVESDRTESADSSEPSDAELAAQELVAQSLAGLPLPTPNIEPALSAAETADDATSSEDSQLQDELAVTSLTTNKPASKSGSRSQPKANNATPTSTADTNFSGDLVDPQSTAATVENGSSKIANDPATLASADKLGAAEVNNSQTSETTPELTQSATPELQLESTTEAAQASFDTSDSTERQDGSQQEETAAADEGADANPNQPTDPTLTPTSAPDPTAVAALPVAAATPNQSPNSQQASANSSPAVADMSARPRLPAQALASAGDAAKARGPVEIDTARLMTRVVRAFSAAQERDGEVRLRLSPAELGSLQLEIRVENGALTAKLHTETDAARTAIIENLPALREKLAEQGVRIERFDVDLMQRQTGGMPDQSGGRQPESPEAPPRFAPAPRTSVSNQAAPSVIAPTAAGAAGGLNVIV